MNPQIITPDFPVSRPRRLRRDDYTRRLVRENALTVNDLIYPVFVAEGNGLKQAVPSLPGVVRYSLDTLLPVAEECVALGIPVLSLFPAIDPALKTPDGIEATNPDGLIPRVVRELKKRFPDLGVLCDVALDPYTSHGQDGVIDENGYVINEPTVEILVKQALTPVSYTHLTTWTSSRPRTGSSTWARKAATAAGAWWRKARRKTWRPRRKATPDTISANCCAACQPAERRGATRACH